MAEFSIRSDAVDVEQIMRQIRARIREKRGADYTEQEIRELANAKLETFLDPSRVRSGLLEQFRALQRAAAPAPTPNYEFEDSTLFETHRPLLRLIRSFLRPLLKLFFNPNRLSEALHIQAEVNARAAELNSRRDHVEELYYELIHNLVVEITRLGIEMKNMRMKVESVAARLDFDERRGRALEGSVLYRPSPAASTRPPRDAAPAGQSPQAPAAPGTGPAVTESGAVAERRRRRRRRGRRRGAGGAEAGEQAGVNAEVGGQPHLSVAPAGAEDRPVAGATPENAGGEAAPHHDEPES